MVTIYPDHEIVSCIFYERKIAPQPVVKKTAKGKLHYDRYSIY